MDYILAPVLVIALWLILGAGILLFAVVWNNKNCEAFHAWVQDKHLRTIAKMIERNKIPEQDIHRHAGIRLGMFFSCLTICFCGPLAFLPIRKMRLQHTRH
jgi:hypothetical protein